MLTLETPTHEFDGIVVFRDHAVPTMFHYLAGPPRLTVRDGKPHLLLLKYRHALDSSSAAPKVRDQLGGGFLTFSVDCGIDEDTLRSIRRELASRVPEGLEDQVSLAPVLYTKGTVKVLALDQRSGLANAPGDDTADSPQGRFVRGILGSATPSLLQEQQAIFSIALSPDGVALLEQAFEAELSPIGVLYELEFSGLRPALSVRVRADQKRIYESFEMGLGVEVDLETDPSRSRGGLFDIRAKRRRARPRSRPDDRIPRAIGSDRDRDHPAAGRHLGRRDARGRDEDDQGGHPRGVLLAHLELERRHPGHP